MKAAIAEFLGTFTLVLIGAGAGALATPGSAGLVAVALAHGWALAIIVYTWGPFSGAHANPAVTLGVAQTGRLNALQAVVYWTAQFAGAIAGSIIVWIAYKTHYDATTDPELLRATFCTAPNIYSPVNNALTEFIGTFILMFGVLAISPAASTLGTLDALPVSLLLLGIGLSLGGPTGYAINPARDLGPRIAHAILPIKHKGNSEWNYAWVPVVAPVLGAILAALVFNYVK